MQHINFYHQLQRDTPSAWHGKGQLLAVAGLAGVMVFAALVLALLNYSAQGQLDQLQQEQQQQAATLDGLRAEKNRRQNDPDLDRAIESLGREVSFRRQLLDQLAHPEGDPAAGFAEHFAGLSRQHIEGLWFTEIQLRAGGREMALLGQTREPEFVPRYLQKLAREPVFAGHHFRVLRMHGGEQQRRPLAFELRAREVGAP